MICWRRVKRKLRSRGIGQNLEIQEAELERPRNELIDENSLIYRDRRGASSSHSSIVVSNNATVHHSQFHMYFYPSFLSLSSHMDVRIFRNCFAARDYYFKKDENEKKISIVTVVKKCTIT